MVIGDFWVGPDCPGLQHQLHIIVPFLLLVPSVLLLPDVICFSNLDAQTQQEPHTHTHKSDALPTVTLAHAAQTYVVLTNVQSACTPSYGIYTPLLHV